MIGAEAIPEVATLEELLVMAGPRVQDLIRDMERPLADLARWRRSHYFQWRSRNGGGL